MRLFELVGEYKQLEALEASEELPAQVILDTLEGLQGELEQKCTQVAMFGRNLEAVAASIEDAASKMLARASVLRKRATSIDAYLLLSMQACGISKLSSPWLTIQVKKNPPAVVIDHEGSIPEKYWRQPETPPTPPKVVDKKLIAAAIKAGEEVPGARTQSGERIEIRI